MKKHCIQFSQQKSLFDGNVDVIYVLELEIANEVRKQNPQNPDKIICFCLY